MMVDGNPLAVRGVNFDGPAPARLLAPSASRPSSEMHKVLYREGLTLEQAARSAIAALATRCPEAAADVAD